MVTSAFDLTGQVALVVGVAPGGLGERAAHALADAGARVAVADLPSRAADLAATAGERVVSVHEVDVTDETSVAALFQDVIAAHGRLDVVVNAAGIMLRKPYDETTVEEFERVVRVNLTGTWLVGREAGKALTRQGSGGRIVNLTTVYAERVGPVPESAYYSSKAGVVNVTRALAAELGPHGVNVNCLAPGVFYPTQMTAALGADPDRLTWFGERTMLGRLGDPATDFAGPLLLLASPAASYMTGQVVYVDGGWSAW
ncbi:SDR family NAD(P)-dependent oxidoreductase [Actinomadura verrucosospora]|uniref:Short-chain dehydrogenase/reductase SDR n=1 Tax=Actinomadura verrucosospora TaxID=46165 RepID=A0A7D4A2I1_ACTVE|nr:SDR family oxidoreductase [Actinomadura verrucosospora]QKG18687.1 short-chain dehydrogenase/reductase SDR [Actinomadura verrucosospora]